MSAGGKREGAGRNPAEPLLKKRAISVRLPEWLIEKMDQEVDNRAILIQDALIKKYGWVRPEKK